jgi:hypothetical protein
MNPGDDQNGRLARVVGQLGQALSPYTLRIYGHAAVTWLSTVGIGSIRVAAICSRMASQQRGLG